MLDLADQEPRRRGVQRLDDPDRVDVARPDLFGKRGEADAARDPLQRDIRQLPALRERGILDLVMAVQELQEAPGVVDPPGEVAPRGPTVSVSNVVLRAPGSSVAVSTTV